MIATDPIHQNHAFRQIPANARSQCVSLQISQSLGNGKHFDESKWKKEYKTAWGTQFNRMMGTSYCPNNATFLILWTRPSVLCRVKTAYFRGNTTIVKKKWRQTILIRQPGCLSQGKTSQHMSAFHFNHHPKQCTTKFNLFKKKQKITTNRGLHKYPQRPLQNYRPPISFADDHLHGKGFSIFILLASVLPSVPLSLRSLFIIYRCDYFAGGCRRRPKSGAPRRR